MLSVLPAATPRVLGSIEGGRSARITFPSARVGRMVGRESHGPGGGRSSGGGQGRKLWPDVNDVAWRSLSTGPLVSERGRGLCVYVCSVVFHRARPGMRHAGSRRRVRTATRHLDFPAVPGMGMTDVPSVPAAPSGWLL